MKYIAIFDIPDDYGIGCAVAKVIKKDKYPRCDSDEMEDLQYEL